VADVGEWLPWDPEPEEVKDQEYQSDDLNKLMQSYKENAAKRDAFFEEEKRQKMSAAAAETKAAKEANAAKEKARVKAPTFGAQGEEQAEVPALFGDSKHADLAMARKAEADIIALD